LKVIRGTRTTTVVAIWDPSACKNHKHGKKDIRLTSIVRFVDNDDDEKGGDGDDVLLSALEMYDDANDKPDTLLLGWPAALGLLPFLAALH